MPVQAAVLLPNRFLNRMRESTYSSHVFEPFQPHPWCCKPGSGALKSSIEPILDAFPFQRRWCGDRGGSSNSGLSIDIEPDLAFLPLLKHRPAQRCLGVHMRSYPALCQCCHRALADASQLLKQSMSTVGYNTVLNHRVVNICTPALHSV